MTSNELFDLVLRGARGGTAAVRAVTKLQPVDGAGGKSAPPTYADAKYALEERIVDGKPVKTVLLDSVQSQANRFEEALQTAFNSDLIPMPVFTVDIPGHGTLTSLTVPHRVHDAILRDSLWGGKPFRESANGKRLAASRAWDATAFYEYAPTSLLFGTWDSQSGAGVNSAKIARSLVSEIVAFHVQCGVKTSSRIDPLGIRLVNEVIFGSADKTLMWEFRQPAIEGVKKLKKTEGSKSLKPSEINHGNVTPTIVGPDGAGGVTFEYAQQTTVLSFTQLRRLAFPNPDGTRKAERDAAGRAVIAALGLCAVTLQWEDGFQLRSRCQLIPISTPKFEWLGKTAEERLSVEMDAGLAQEVLKAALQHAEAEGLRWHAGRIPLEPRPDLVKLIQYSDQLTDLPEGA